MSETLYKIRVESPTREFLSTDTFTKDEARAEIKRRRNQGGWDRCRFFITSADYKPLSAEDFALCFPR